MTYPSLGRSLLSVFLLLILRKVCIALISMNTVRLSWDQVSMEAMIERDSFREVVGSLPTGQETYVLILNQHALNMTLNWLCNTVHLPGVHNNSLVVTLDQHATAEIRNIWTGIRILEWIVPGLESPFNYGDGPYQLLYLFRANLARALLHMNRTFWMIQQDTFWADSLTVSIKDSHDDIIFDKASEHGPLVAGGYYGAKPTKGAKDYFEKLSWDLSWWYAPDNAYMTSMCQLSGLAKCGHLPFSLITNWQWLDRATGKTPPKFIQFDGETRLGGKLAKMRTLGFYFLNEDGRTCNSSSFDTVRNSLQSRTDAWSQVASYSHGQFKFYQNVVDTLYSSRITAWILDRWILPYAHYCMLSL